MLATCGQATPGTIDESKTQSNEVPVTESQMLKRVIHVRYSSTSDSANLHIRNSEIIQDYQVLESWGEPSLLSVSEHGIAIEQAIENASNGEEVGVLVEYQLVNQQSPAEIKIILEKGDLNTAFLIVLDATGTDEFVLEEYEHTTTSKPNDFNRTHLIIMVGGAAPEVTEKKEVAESVGGFIFYNGTILTMDPDQPIAQAIFIQNESIFALGTQEEILAMAGEDTTLIDLDERTLMPGFVDGHAHSFNNIWRDDFEAGQKFLLAQGITATAEMFVEEPLIQDFQAFDEANQLRMRVSLYPVRVDNCGEDRGEWYWPDYPVSIEDGAMLQIPGIKIFSDGGSCNRPARSFEYPDGSLGDLYHDAETLAGIIQQAQQRGYQVAIHGLGDRAINVNLDAVEMALNGGPNILHHRLEHNTLLSDDMFSRYSEVDPVTMIFGFFPTCFFTDDTGEFQYGTPPEYEQMEWAWRSLIDANPGLHIAWHSDSPWVGQPEPMKHIYGFLTRRDIREDGTVCNPPAWATDDLLTIEEVLPMMTIESAYAIRRDYEIGSLEADKLADLIILSANPLEVETDAILDIRVLMTMVGGKVQHCLTGNSELCPQAGNSQG
jgi:hypothetical protein